MFSFNKPPETEDFAWIAVGPADLVGRGKTAVVEAGGWRILLCHTQAGISAVENRCSHQALPLDRARIIGGQLICPHHGARFDLETGCPVAGVAVRGLRIFPVTVIDDELLIHLPVPHA